MEFLTVLATFCVAVSIVLPTCASSDLQESIKQHGNSAAEQAKFTLPDLLPRKLKLQQEIVTIFDDKDIVPRKKLMEASSDKKKVESEKEEKMVGTGNRENNVEGLNKSSKSSSDYLTMDYAWLKRRRPIHNKHVPVNPAP